MTREELKLIEEMKDNCIKKANYIDVKAMDKYNALRNLLEENKMLKEDIKNLISIINNNYSKLVSTKEEFESLRRWNK